MNRPRVLVLAVVAIAMLPASASAAAADAWTRWSGSPRSAPITSVDLAAGSIFAAGSSDGVFSATHAWAQRNLGLVGPGATSVNQVAAAADGALYAATAGGLFRSTDGSASWARTGAASLPASAVTSVVGVGAGGLVAGLAGPVGGVWNSTDGGVSWTRATNVAAQVNRITRSGTTLAAATDDGVYLSTDAGATWALRSDGIATADRTLAVAFDPANPAQLFAATATTVYRSTDTGTTWRAAEGLDGLALPAGARRSLLAGTGPEAGRVLAGTDAGAWASLDGGAHWQPMSTTTTAPDAASPLGSQAVSSLAFDGAATAVHAGTTALGVFSLPVQDLDAGSVTISPTSSLAPGKELTATLTGFDGTAPRSTSYQWKRCQGVACTPVVGIPGATGRTYVVPEDDGGVPNVRYAVSVAVTNLGDVETDDSNITTAGVAATAAATPRPSYTMSQQPSLSAPATPRVGDVLTIQPGQWRTQASSATIDPSFTYLWQRCDATCAVIPGATLPTYTATELDLRHSLRASIRGTTPSSGSDFYLAGVSGTVGDPVPAPLAAPRVVGAAAVGGTLQSAAGRWSGTNVTFERQWLRCAAEGAPCAAIPSATAATYEVGAADAGSRLQLQVTAGVTGAGAGHRVTALSAQTDVAAAPAPPPNPPLPPQPGSPNPTDTAAPVLAIALPPCAKRWTKQQCARFRASRAAWRIVRGTVRDRGTPTSGVARVEVAVYRKLGRKFQVVAGTRLVVVPTLAAAQARTARAAVRGTAWSRAPFLLPVGSWVVRARAVDRAGNASRWTTRAVPLTR